MPRIIFAMPPFGIIFIIFCVCSNWSSRRLTSCTCTPAPAAMRRLREALISSGMRALLRGHGVDDALDAADLLRPCRPTAPAPPAPAAPAACPSWRRARPSSHLADLRLEVLQVEALAPFEFFCELAAPRDRRSRCASSISDSTSPMPRIREAMRSGWNSSRPLSFSPTPANLIGAPVTWRTDSAAPPRASPSSLVRMTPVSGSGSRKARAVLTASWPCIASTTNSVSIGFSAACSSVIFGHHRRVDREAARGVDDQHVVVMPLRVIERLPGDVARFAACRRRRGR